MSHPIHFFGVALERAEFWNNTLNLCLSTLSDRERSVIPPIYVYNTTIQSIHATFDATHPFVDKLLDRFSEEKIWAFCMLQDPELRNPSIPIGNYKRIVFANNRVELTYDLAPEPVIFHEFFHFIDTEINKRPYLGTDEQLDQIEWDCDMFAYMAYIRMILLNPTYASQAYSDTTRSLESWARAFASSEEDMTHQRATEIAMSLKEKIIKCSKEQQ